MAGPTRDFPRSIHRLVRSTRADAPFRLEPVGNPHCASHHDESIVDLVPTLKHRLEQRLSSEGGEDP